MTSLAKSIETYINAKDGNRPHLIADAFTPDAQLAMELRTDEISFPGHVEGAAGIAKVLVSDFALRYENVYTFCVASPPPNELSFDCHWLVCMTEKSTASARVGFGRYQWHYDDQIGKVSQLRIIIEAMNTLPSQCAAPILDWARTLPYPWCPSDIAARTAPAFAPVQSVAGELERLALRR